MNKNILFLLMGLSVLIAGNVYSSERRVETYASVMVTGSSGAVTDANGYAISGPLWVQAVELSSATTNTPYGAAWMVLIDTVPITNVTSYASFASTNKKTSPMIFTSTSSASGIAPYSNIREWPYPGLFIGTTMYYYKTNAASGEAFTGVIHYKK